MQGFLLRSDVCTSRKVVSKLKVVNVAVIFNYFAQSFVISLIFLNVF